LGGHAGLDDELVVIVCPVAIRQAARIRGAGLGGSHLLRDPVRIGGQARGGLRGQQLKQAGP
jgi:hypothetical protein